MTPATAGARPAGTRGDEVGARTTRPLDRRASINGTPKACSTCAVLPLTGSRRWLAETVPTWRPVDANHLRVAATVAELGPNSVANCPACR